MRIVLDQVSKVYNSAQPNEVVALERVSLAIDKGEMVCLEGPSGSGKTTLLSILGCVIAPTGGSASIGDKKIARLPDHFRTSYRRQLVGFVFQHFNLLEERSLLENVTLPLYPLGVSPRVRRERALPLLQRLAIDHRRDFPVRQLSGGERQRAAIARALINDPPLLIADEPTAHLDRPLAGEIMDIFAALKAEGRTVIIASHDPLVVTHPAVTRRLALHGGRLLADPPGQR
jgi:putative ABC transport system ATP-binding protein